MRTNSEEPGEERLPALAMRKEFLSAHDEAKIDATAFDRLKSGVAAGEKEELDGRA